MKGNKTDDLFRNGLGSHKITPPSAAWDKIESQLPRKSKKGIYFWMSIAASILLILTFGWLIISNNQDDTSSNSEVQANIETVTPEPPKVKTPAALINKEAPTQQLVADNTATNHSPKTDIKKTQPATTPILVDLPQSNKLQASNDDVVVDKINLVQPIVIQFIKLDMSTHPVFMAGTSNNEVLSIDITVNLNSYINSYEIMTGESSKRKRFSLLSGIVNVAKGVNSSKLAFSEMRKSKNDFFNNDLKYGSKEAEPEDIDQDLNEK